MHALSKEISHLSRPPHGGHPFSTMKLHKKKKLLVSVPIREGPPESSLALCTFSHFNPIPTCPSYPNKKLITFFLAAPGRASSYVGYIIYTLDDVRRHMIRLLFKNSLSSGSASLHIIYNKSQCPPYRSLLFVPSWLNPSRGEIAHADTGIILFSPRNMKFRIEMMKMAQLSTCKHSRRHLGSRHPAAA